jgi:hypothetical protein
MSLILKYKRTKITSDGRSEPFYPPVNLLLRTLNVKTSHSSRISLCIPDSSTTRFFSLLKESHHGDGLDFPKNNMTFLPAHILFLQCDYGSSSHQKIECNLLLLESELVCSPG